LVNRKNLALLGLGVAVLLVVVAFVANGGPLGTAAPGGGSGSATLPSSFGDFVFTTAVILAALIAIALSAVFLSRRLRLRTIGGDYVEGVLGPVLAVLAIFVIFGVAERLFLAHHHKPHGPRQSGHYERLHPHKKVAAASAHFVWSEAAIVAALLLLAVAIFIVTSRRRGVLPPFPIAPQAVAAALDESLDDLRTDPDLPRAIMAAYARMEVALGAGGTPRRPSEAPREYLERALIALDASGSAVQRLTELFELVRFSAHETEPEMRDDAIHALAAVRDELRLTAAVAA